MAIPDWVQQSVSAPAPLPGAVGWQQPPQDPYEAAAQAGMPYQPPPVEQAPIMSTPEQAPQISVAPQATMDPQEQPVQAGTMSVAPAQPVASEINYSPMPPEAPPQPAPVVQQDPTESVVNMMLANYLRPKAYPQAVVKASETWQQAVPSAMPGQEAPYAAARQALEEQQNEALLDQRLQLMDRADMADQETRNAYLQGRGFAAEASAIADEQEQRRAVIDERVGELDRLIEQRSKLQTSFAERNPVRDMSMWTRIAIGIGAAGQALAGGQNAALELAMREIDADMSKQRDQVDALGLEIAGKRTLLGDMLQKFRDPAAADHATRAAMLGLYESGYRAQAAKEKSAEMRAAMTNAADALAVQREQEKLASLTGEHQTLMRWRPAGAVPGGIQGLRKMASDLGFKDGTPEFREFMQKGISGQLPQYIASGGEMGGPNNLPRDQNARERVLAARDLEVRVPSNIGGGIGYVPKGSAPEVRKNLDAISKLQGLTDQVRALSRKHSNLSPTDRQLVEGIATTAVGIMSQATGAGAPTGQERDEYGKVLTAGVNNFFTGDSKMLLGSLQRILDVMKRPALEQLTQDPAGTKPFQVGPRRLAK